jgi:hypothetical protein
MQINNANIGPRVESVERASGVDHHPTKDAYQRSAAVTLELSRSAIARATEAARLAEERSASRASEPRPAPAVAATTVAAPRKSSPPAKELNSLEAMDPKLVHQHELEALLATHTGTQLYVIQRTLDELIGRTPETAPVENEPSAAETAHLRRERLRLIESKEAQAAPPEAPARSPDPPAKAEVPLPPTPEPVPAVALPSGKKTPEPSADPGPPPPSRSTFEVVG